MKYALAELSELYFDPDKIFTGFYLMTKCFYSWVFIKKKKYGEE
jgi:hypothetical protein